MSRQPTRGSTAGRIYLALRKKARAEDRATDELLQLCALEAFVDRLSTSPSAHDLILKGGVLLSAYDVRRPTRDVDLATHHTPNDPESVRQVINQVLAEPRTDGWVFAPSSAEVIREGNAYTGVRVTVPCALATARVTFHVDVNIGDVVWPPATSVTVPKLLGGEISVRAYSLSMILAEKLVTAVQRGTTNTRWRDFADIHLLSGKHVLQATTVHESIRRVAAHRMATLSPLSVVLAGFGELAAAKWIAWVRKQRMADRLPAAFHTVLEEVVTFADPLLIESSSRAAWDPATRMWNAQ